MVWTKVPILSKLTRAICSMVVLVGTGEAAFADSVFEEFATTLCLTDTAAQSALPDVWVQLDGESDAYTADARAEFEKYTTNQPGATQTVYGNTELDGYRLVKVEGGIPGFFETTSCGVVRLGVSDPFPVDWLTTLLGSEPSFSGPTGPYDLKQTWQNPPNAPNAVDISVVFQASGFGGHEVLSLSRVELRDLLTGDYGEALQ